VAAPTPPRRAIPPKRSAVTAGDGARGEILVRLQPRARADEILGEREGALLVRVTAPALEGRANDALCRLIAKRAGVGVGRVSILRGMRAREKVLRVDGLTSSELRRALGASGSTGRPGAPGTTENKT
jgi:uncharacterized protein YggU (UPF0235/DUF167 family)